MRGAACNLHTALALVAKMRGLGIAARCDTLVMQPTLAMQRRKQRRFQQQARPLGRTPRAGCGVSAFQGAAGRCSYVLPCSIVLRPVKRGCSPWLRKSAGTALAMRAAAVRCARIETVLVSIRVAYYCSPQAEVCDKHCSCTLCSSSALCMHRK